jgi:hypothetical protein
MTDYAAIYAEATAAAKKAAADYGPEDTVGLNCGFAWVVFKPATHPFIKWCKANRAGDRHWAGGWCFWSPAKAPVQQIEIHKTGADAFAKVLKAHFPGVNIVADSRYD